MQKLTKSTAKLRTSQLRLHSRNSTNLLHPCEPVPEISRVSWLSGCLLEAFFCIEVKVYSILFSRSVPNPICWLASWNTTQPLGASRSVQHHAKLGRSAPFPKIIKCGPQIHHNSCSTLMPKPVDVRTPSESSWSLPRLWHCQMPQAIRVPRHAASGSEGSWICRCWSGPRTKQHCNVLRKHIRAAKW